MENVLLDWFDGWVHGYYFDGLVLGLFLWCIFLVVVGYIGGLVWEFIVKFCKDS